MAFATPTKTSSTPVSQTYFPLTNKLASDTASAGITKGNHFKLSYNMEHYTTVQGIQYIVFIINIDSDLHSNIENLLYLRLRHYVQQYLNFRINVIKNVIKN